MPKIFEFFGITMSKLYIKEAKDAGNLSVDLLFSDFFIILPRPVKALERE